MRKLLNTLYVSTQGAWLSKEGESLRVMDGKSCLARLPIHQIGGIVCFGRVSISPPLMAFCAERDVSISFLTEWGRFQARVVGPVKGNVLLRRTQYRVADDADIHLPVAANIITAKIANCRSLLRRANRDHSPNGRLANAADRLGMALEALRQQATLEGFRGVEGEAALQYFTVFSELISTQDKAFAFAKRNRRPPLDRVNCLLSFAYALLLHDVRSALESWGLDPAVGFLHRDRPGRPSLALDLMEEFRPVLADRLCLSLVNRGQVKARGFELQESGAVRMKDKTRRTVISAWQNRKKEEVRHPYLDERMPWGMVIHAQAGLLARHLRGDLDGYPPFMWR